MSLQRTGPFFKLEIMGGVLVGGQRHAAARIGLEARRPDLQPVVAGGQVLDAIAALLVGQHADHDLGLGVAGLHERAAERRAVRALHGAGDGGRVRRAWRKRENSEYPQKQLG